MSERSSDKTDRLNRFRDILSSVREVPYQCVVDNVTICQPQSNGCFITDACTNCGPAAPPAPTRDDEPMDGSFTRDDAYIIGPVLSSDDESKSNCVVKSYPDQCAWVSFDDDSADAFRSFEMAQPIDYRTRGSKGELHRSMPSVMDDNEDDETGMCEEEEDASGDSDKAVASGGEFRTSGENTNNYLVRPETPEEEAIDHAHESMRDKILEATRKYEQEMQSALESEYRELIPHKEDTAPRVETAVDLDHADDNSIIDDDSASSSGHHRRPRRRRSQQRRRSRLGRSLLRRASSNSCTGSKDGGRSGSKSDPGITATKEGIEVHYVGFSSVLQGLTDDIACGAVDVADSIILNLSMSIDSTDARNMSV